MPRNKIKPTPKLIAYCVKFFFRISAFAIMIFLYIRDKQAFFEYTETPVSEGINFMHVMWCVYMGLMTLHLLPMKFLSMGAGKAVKGNFQPVPNYSKEKLAEFVKQENKSAGNCMIVWLAGNAIVGIFYFMGIIGKPELLLLTGFYFISDYICILIFCPFQTFGMKNKCCINCRIYDWGHFMMFTPMVFVGSFYCLSLFLMGTAVILHWEYFWRKYPERFWSGSNQILHCANCREKTCQIKKAVRNSLVN